MVGRLHYVTYPGQLGEHVADAVGRMLKRLGQLGRRHLAWVAAQMVDNEIPQLPTSQPDLVTARVVLLGEVQPIGQRSPTFLAASPAHYPALTLQVRQHLARC
jgi:hypothetical protein